jgi:hypothetical protein
MMDLQRAVTHAMERLQAALDRFLASGLEYRGASQTATEGSPFGAHLWNDDGLIYRKLVAAGATLPHGVGVCEDCNIVFRTRRKGFAAKCPRCHATPKPRPTREHERWGSFPRAPHVKCSTRRRSIPVGWQVVHVHRCQNCGETVISKRRDATFCGERCRVESHRARKKQRQV